MLSWEHFGLLDVCVPPLSLEIKGKTPTSSVELNLVPGTSAVSKYQSNPLSHRDKVHDAAMRGYYCQSITGEAKMQNLPDAAQQSWENPTASDILGCV